MSFIETYLIGLAVVLGMMTILWLVSLKLKNASIVDIFWGMGFVLAAWVYFFLTPEFTSARKWLLPILVTIWGLRLSIHILLRNAGKGEDFRYVKWREENGASWWWRSFFKVFLLQGILLWIISAPLLAAQRSNTALGVLDIIGAALWAVGFFFEAVGDAQLKAFLANPENRGKIMDRGVWGLTRHPNYFGDSAQWWGYYLLALAAGGWWAIFSPIMMTYLLTQVSGAKLLEQTMMQKPGYPEYAARVNGFFPWFPKKNKN